MPAWLAPIAGKAAALGVLGVLALVGIAFAVWWLRRGAKKEDRLEGLLETKERQRQAGEEVARLRRQPSPGPWGRGMRDVGEDGGGVAGSPEGRPPEP